jgi:enamine deaminase RidA (YjgF/YER057c/UK114 family)
LYTRVRYDVQTLPKPSEQENPLSNTFLNPSTMPATRGYTHVVETKGPGRTVYIAGQLGMTPEGKFAGASGDFRAQAVQCFENLKTALKAVGGGFEHVVKITNYFVDMAHLQTFCEVRDRYVNIKAPPASTAIQIVKLAREGALFEIEAVAVLPAKTVKSAAKRASKSAKKLAVKRRR